MPAKGKVCFVISPIGEDGGPVRQAADDLYELVIQPALEKYNFAVIRADKIPRPAVITADIIQLVQDAELCIIDLTNHNPNVFYECGRRHETGKPFIQIIKRGEVLPFDLAGIRTLSYDISTPRSTYESIKAIQQFVDEFEKAGYTPGSGGVSLSSIASTLDRIERRLIQLSTTEVKGNDVVNKDAPDSFGILKDVRSMFLEAIAVSDFRQADRLLPALEDRLGLGQELFTAAVMVAPSGSKRAIDLLVKIFINQGDYKQYGLDALKPAIMWIVTYASAVDREVDYVPIIKPIVMDLVSNVDMPVREKAFLFNQLQRLLYGAGEYEEALDNAIKVVEWVPEEPAYAYNLSLLYEALNQPRKALEMVDKYMAMGGKQDPARLSHAVEIYVEAGRNDDARKVLEVLEELSPSKAKLLLLDGKVAQAIGREG